VFVLVFDDLSFARGQGRAALAAAGRWLASVPAGDTVGFSTTTGTVVANPTTDRVAVSAVMRAAEGRRAPERDRPVGIPEAIEIDAGSEPMARRAIVRECFAGDDTASRDVPLAKLLSSGNACPALIVSEAKRTADAARQSSRDRLASLTAVADALRNAPGLRHIVLVTAGMVVDAERLDLRGFTRATAAHGVQVSVILDGSGDDAATDDASRATRRRDDARLFRRGAEAIAEATGGFLYGGDTDADAAFRRVLASSGAVYRIRVAVPAGADPAALRAIEVAVARPDVVARANPLAVPVPAQPAAAGADAGNAAARVKAALAANTTIRELALRAGASVRRSGYAAGQVDVSLNVELPASFAVPGEAFVGVVDSSNAMRLQSTAVPSASSPAQFVFPLAPGEYRLRFGVTDASGAAGTIEVPVRAELHPFGAFAASDVLTWTVDDAGRAQMFSTDTVPTVEVLNASIEVYPKGVMPSEPPVVQWTITAVAGDAGATPSTDALPLIDEEVPGRVGPNFFRADFEILTARLTPGTYVIRATLVSPADAGPAPSVSAAVRKR
jgi:hypothetical protein